MFAEVIWYGRGSPDAAAVVWQIATPASQQLGGGGRSLAKIKKDYGEFPPGGSFWLGAWRRNGRF
jgi:hypothetical protein